MEFFPRLTNMEQMSYEVSDSYFTSQESPSRVNSLLKYAKILIVLEDPVKRAFYHYQVSIGIVLGLRDLLPFVKSFHCKDLLSRHLEQSLKLYINDKRTKPLDRETSLSGYLPFMFEQKGRQVF